MATVLNVVNTRGAHGMHDKKNMYIVKIKNIIFTINSFLCLFDVTGLSH